MSQPQDQDLIRKVAAYVESYMSSFDGSHDFYHIKRVLALSRQILSEIEAENEKYSCSGDNGSANTKQKFDRTVIALAALLHDIGDRKYLREDEDGDTLVRDLLLSCGASQALAEKVQTICLGVSYSSEMKDVAYVVKLIEQYPELAVVQDADRLDAIGAVGVGRLFTYGAVRLGRDMGASMGIMDIKLFRLEGMMKTGPGRRLARERMERLRVFREWWDEEASSGELDI